MDRKRANAINAHIGRRICLRRSLLGLSQKCLAKKLGKMTAQVRRIEEGAKDIKMPELHQYAEALGVPVDYFFKGLDRPDPFEVALEGISGPLPIFLSKRWSLPALEFERTSYHSSEHEH